jgi:predicted ATPase/DNA-binding winged helix-turn-helix (wHTH) protein
VTTRYRFGRIEVRPAERKVLAEGRPVPVGARAFDVLVALIEHRDRIVSKDELLDIAWPGMVVEENNLQVQISTIRKHLGPRAVATISNRGYQFTLEPETEAPPLRPAASRHNLPCSITSFVGRERERTELRSLLDCSRLVTLVGMGGVGKTRLALQLGTETLDAYADGTRFVELAGVGHGERVADAIAAALGVEPDPHRPPMEALLKHLHGRKLLLILDNCEHLLHSCVPLVRNLLESAPGLSIVATSREALRIPGEVVFPVPRLTLPAAGGDRESPLSTCDAMQLFAERAKAASTSFAITPANVDIVGELCRRLDGIPLALELAAARLRALSIEAMAARLDERFRLLKLEVPYAAPRHQALRTCLDWSHDLLTEQERIVLRRLGVFVGGCTIDAAEAVAADSLVAPRDVVDLLANLVEKSMVEHDARTDRYDLLETVRQYAVERLVESADERGTRARHMQHYVGLAEAANPNLVGPDPRPWFNRLDAERENLLAAHAFCDVADDGAEQGLRLAYALNRYWMYRPLIALGRRMVTQALARPGVESHPVLHAKALVRAGACAHFMRDDASARQLLGDCLAIPEAETETVVNARRLLGMVFHSLGDLQAAREQYETCLALRAQLNDTLQADLCLMHMASLQAELGDFASAERIYADSLANVTEEQHPHFHATVLFSITSMHIQRGAAALARKTLAKAVRIIERLDLIVLRPQALEITAGVAALEGDAERAARCLGAAGAEMKQTRMHYSTRGSVLREPLIRAARDAIGAEAFAAAEAKGGALSYQEALAEARVWLSSSHEVPRAEAIDFE